MVRWLRDDGRMLCSVTRSYSFICASNSHLTCKDRWHGLWCLPCSSSANDKNQFPLDLCWSVTVLANALLLWRGEGLPEPQQLMQNGLNWGLFTVVEVPSFIITAGSLPARKQAWWWRRSWQFYGWICRQQEQRTPGPGWSIWNLRAHPQWHTSS